MNHKIESIDEFKEWIVNLTPTKNGWKATFYPNKIVEVMSFKRLIEELLIHVMNETVELSLLALNITDKSFLKVSRRSSGHKKTLIFQDLSDSKIAIANIVYDRFKNKISQVIIESAMGWKSHGMLHYALNNSEVKQVKDKINKIYKTYPFLANGYKDMK